MASTSTNVFLFPAGTLAEGPVALSRESWRFDLTSEEWKQGQPLPERFFLSDATAIEDTVFAVGGYCDVTTPDSPEDNCTETALLSLTDGGKWSSTALTPSPLRLGQFPEQVFRVGASSVGIGVSGDPERALIVLDTETDEWAEVAPPGAQYENLAICATNGAVFARTVSTDVSVQDDGLGRRYQFEMWALDGLEWSEPIEVDLGVVTSQSGVGGSELCSGGSFVASNASDDGAGVVVRGADTLTTVPATVPVPTAGPSHSAAVAGIFDQRVVVTVEDGDVGSIELPNLDSLRAGSLLVTSEWQQRMDLLIAESDSAGPVPIRIASKSRSPQGAGDG